MEPASLLLNPTPLELCHSWLFNLATIPSLVPITRHAHVQISCINNCGNPSQFGSTEEGKEGPEKLSAVGVGGKVQGDSRARRLLTGGPSAQSRLGVIGK